MRIIASLDEIQHELAGCSQEQVALVPTMGCLHEGHLSLIRQAKRLADVVVVSIYVNPLQFSEDEDLDNYPQPFTHDAKLCEAEGVDYLFHPENLYPPSGIQVGLSVQDLSQQLCGASRHEHFDGVVTVVNILCNLIRPNNYIFGEKDFQQLAIIRRMTHDLHMSVEIVEGKTIREEDGLAKSSRNRYLNVEQRQQAAHLASALRLMQKSAENNAPIHHILEVGEHYLKTHDISPEYLVIGNENTLRPMTDTKDDDPLRIFIAAPIGSARLIDNMPLFPNVKDEDTTPCA